MPAGIPHSHTPSNTDRARVPRSPHRRLLAAGLVLLLGLATACGEQKATKGGGQDALVLGLARFGDEKTEAGLPKPLPAALEFVWFDGTEWKTQLVEDADSDVFHKAMAYPAPDGTPTLLTVAGTKAMVKLWTKQGGALEAKTVWQKDFGGKFSRMRDVEVGDVYGDGKATLVVATHDQGVVAVLHPEDDGTFTVEEVDHEPNTFVHEIELGDVDGDGVMEAYATPSEPNRLDGSPQSGKVVRYVPKKGEGRKVVADLGDRHAKEIKVEDVDGDGRDELYVIVEGHVDGSTKQLIHGVEIRRYEADTPPDAGVVIAEVEDRLGRFLTVGDFDGDGKKEMIAALFSTGVWMLEPGDDPMKPWKVSLADRKSGGFEHASIAADLDGDGKDELYVASDRDNELRRYTWDGEKLARETIYRRRGTGSVFTWNIMPIPAALVP